MSAPTFNVYGGQVDDPGTPSRARVGLAVPAAHALELAVREVDADDETTGWLASAINDLRADGASVRVENADGRWVRIVRAGP